MQEDDCRIDEGPKADNRRFNDCYSFFSLGKPYRVEGFSYISIRCIRGQGGQGGRLQKGKGARPKRQSQRRFRGG